uniref:Peptidase S26 domain-containing protein n=1 Tax=Chrysotila carterae TaxID=13221 RepID=A0A7S4F4Y9_CHRCT
MFAHLPSRLCARLIHRRRAYSSSVSAAEQPAGVKGLFGDGESISSTALDLLQFGAFVAMVNRFFVTITQCTGPSMLPTIGTSGDIFLTIPLRIPQWLGIERPRVGDVVIAISPTDPTQTVCKRVLGLPGDALRAEAPPGWSSEHARDVVVPHGHVWLQGDNARNSTDSRSYGPVPLALLQGLVVLKLYPLSDAGWLREAKPNAVRGPIGERTDKEAKEAREVREATELRQMRERVVRDESLSGPIDSKQADAVEVETTRLPLEPDAFEASGVPDFRRSQPLRPLLSTDPTTPYYPTYPPYPGRMADPTQPSYPSSPSYPSHHAGPTTPAHLRHTPSSIDSALFSVPLTRNGVEATRLSVQTPRTTSLAVAADLEALLPKLQSADACRSAGADSSRSADAPSTAELLKAARDVQRALERVESALDQKK